MLPWNDIYGSVAVIAISALYAFIFHRQGRYSFATGFYWSLSHLAFSAFIALGNYGNLIGGWWAFPFFFVLSSVTYFATLGALVTFKYPKNVRCFRCEYVQFPYETDESESPFDEAEWKAFRSLDLEKKKLRK